MIEDLSITDLPNEIIDLEEIVLKYTCKDCIFITTKKADMDAHVKMKHLPCVNEQVEFECVECKHIFNEIEDYNSHIKTHEKPTQRGNKPEKSDGIDIELDELEKHVYFQILEAQMKEIIDGETRNDNFENLDTSKLHDLSVHIASLQHNTSI